MTSKDALKIRSALIFQYRIETDPARRAALLTEITACNIALWIH